MDYSFEGILRRVDGSYYYDETKFPQVKIPVAPESEVTYRRKRSQIDEWWGVTNNMPKLPNAICTAPWHYVNGGYTVYEPVEWVPTVHLINAIPKSELKPTFKRTTTKLQSERLYGKISAVMSASASASYASMKVDASIRVEGEVEAELNTKTVEEKTEEETIGDKPIVEVVFGMNIRVKPAYSWRFVRDVWHRGHIVWNTWNELVHSAHGLVAQVLPVLSRDRITGLHVALRAPEWQDFYAYVSGHQGPEVAGEEKRVWLAMKLVATLLAVDQQFLFYCGLT
ncbi:hypothetical protein P168DRAFT_317203 [Aspergillus campestris IBT 28561]|uniref:Uncharacterized protein n=1 Tax=Aspergillus campestris (strain IBT 28561) TaxID=1392248 RepID=A0A2I1D719_ASPC2|nr:uncharacterized protein P168DRAFT_317203 [Aspergillus campestris IBT 28561]PKY05680.1 hypothetical protein P168DRAFT_317203 [Aspergillus campestris IBT 28561]